MELIQPHTYRLLQFSTSSKKDRLENLLGTHKLPNLTANEIRLIDEAGKKAHHRQYVSNMVLTLKATHRFVHDAFR